MSGKISILITGGAGFVGSYLCRMYKEKYPDANIVAFDNLHRRGSEFNLNDFKKRGIRFVHGDIRCPGDIEAIGETFDLFIEASAEPSVLIGLNCPDNYAIQTNLIGTINCLNFAFKHAGYFIFLSSSRVYSIDPLRNIPLKEGDTRFYIDTSKDIMKGLSVKGINEDFPTNTARSLYGATKLASELLIQEYVRAYGLKAIINRCGVICGPGQFGKVEQGVFTLWMANHYFKKPLKYTGFGGKGKQVRDILHPKDLFEVLNFQIEKMDGISGEIFNIGGGTDVSVSLLELTQICKKITQNEVPIESDEISHNVDIPLFITDYTKATQAFNWKPKTSVEDIVKDIYRWIVKNEDTVQSIF